MATVQEDPQHHPNSDTHESTTSEHELAARLLEPLQHHVNSNGHASPGTHLSGRPPISNGADVADKSGEEERAAWLAQMSRDSITEEELQHRVHDPRNFPAHNPPTNGQVCR